MTRRVQPRQPRQPPNLGSICDRALDRGASKSTTRPAKTRCDAHVYARDRSRKPRAHAERPCQRPMSGVHVRRPRRPLGRPPLPLPSGQGLGTTRHTPPSIAVPYLLERNGAVRDAIKGAKDDTIGAFANLADLLVLQRWKGTTRWVRNAKTPRVSTPRFFQTGFHRRGPLSPPPPFAWPLGLTRTRAPTRDVSRVGCKWTPPSAGTDTQTRGATKQTKKISPCSLCTALTTIGNDRAAKFNQSRWGEGGGKPWQGEGPKSEGPRGSTALLPPHARLPSAQPPARHTRATRGRGGRPQAAKRRYDRSAHAHRMNPQTRTLSMTNAAQRRVRWQLGCETLDRGGRRAAMGRRAPERRFAHRLGARRSGGRRRANYSLGVRTRRRAKQQPLRTGVRSPPRCRLVWKGSVAGRASARSPPGAVTRVERGGRGGRGGEGESREDDGRGGRGDREQRAGNLPPATRDVRRAPTGLLLLMVAVASRQPYADASDAARSALALRGQRAVGAGQWGSEGKASRGGRRGGRGDTWVKGTRKGGAGRMREMAPER